MIVMHPQYLTDENDQRKAVVLPMAEWESLLEELEELEDIRAYDEAKAEGGEAVEFGVALREIREGRVP